MAWHWKNCTDVGAVRFGLLLTTPYLNQVRRKYGNAVLGLDSVWKWTKLGIPIWLLVADIQTHGGIIVAIIVSSTGGGRRLGKALKHLFLEDPEGDSKPIFMIDHDDAERIAVEYIEVRDNVILLTFSSHNSFYADFIPPRLCVKS